MKHIGNVYGHCPLYEVYLICTTFRELALLYYFYFEINGDDWDRRRDLWDTRPTARPPERI